MRDFILGSANLLSWFWRLIPARLRTGFVTGLFVLDSRNPASADGLRRLLLLKDKLEWVINERAMVYGANEHPKHRLTGYHQFFIDRIDNGERILDVGCGYGSVARSIAREYPRCLVAGLDVNESRLAQAKSAKNPPNLTFVLGDATRKVPHGEWDVVVMSNVLEHVSNRVNFLSKLKEITLAKRFLIRVPLFERDWQLPLRRELGINYYSDDDHKIEHRLEEFQAEIKASGLYAAETLTLWGEIWADCRHQ